MKVSYTITETRSVQAEVELDSGQEIEWKHARTDDERRAVMEAAARDHARTEGGVYGLQVDVGLVPEDDDDEGDLDRA